MTEIVEKGGYDVEFVGNEPHNVSCCICLFVLREPMQAEQCGHRFCKSCVEDLKNSQNGMIVCPEDREVVNVFKDNGKKREILNLIVKCSNHKRGCTTVVELRSLKDHLKICAFQLIQCPLDNCKTKIQRNLLAKHKMENHDEDRIDLLEKKFEQAMQSIEGLSRENLSKTQEMKQAMQSIEYKTQKIEQAMQRIQILEQETQLQKGKLESQESQLQLKTQEIDRLKQTIEAVNYSSYIWKVNGFSKKFRQAQQDRNCNPQTRTIFTSKGYQIKAKIYLNGEGDSWNENLSIFFGLEPGPFDDTLKWPMAAVFTSSLLSNGVVEDQHAFDTKRIPKNDRHIYQRPKELGNGSFGSNLIYDNKLSKYCAGDTITIKIEISHY